jgi:hypothetical protein
MLVARGRAKGKNIPLSPKIGRVIGRERTIPRPMARLSTAARFDLVVDGQAKGWLDEHPIASRLFIAFRAIAGLLFTCASL